MSNRYSFKKKILYSLILALLFFELILQLSSFAFFYHVRMNNDFGFKVASNQVYCVGDSFTYGLFSTKSFSQIIEELYLKEKREIEFLNLGLPGTSTLQHIEVLKTLPLHSKVILRTGANNHLRDTQPYNTFGYNIQCKSFHMLRNLTRHFSSPDPGTFEGTNSKVISKLKKVIQERDLEVFLLPYPGFETTISSELEKLDQLHHLPAVDEFLAGVPEEYLSFDQSHLNEKGYEMEARQIKEYLDLIEFTVSPDKG